MEFQFNVNKLLHGKFSVISSDRNSLIVHPIHGNSNDCQKKDKSKNEDSEKAWRESRSNISSIVDVMGEKSAKAQGLRMPITSTPKLLKSDHRLYVMKDSDGKNGLGAVIGILKIGVKKLFMSDERGAFNEVNPLSVLDFYVHESKQRQGFGHELFEAMLKFEQVVPVQLAIDQPSTDLLHFLKKHYGLQSAVIQANNFAIFPGFFKKVKEDATKFKTGRLAKKNYSNINEEKDALQEFPIQSNYRYQKNVPLSSSAKGCLQWNDSALEKNKYSRHRWPQAAQNTPPKCADKAIPAPSVNLEHKESGGKGMASKIPEIVHSLKQATITESYSTTIDSSSANRSQRKWDEMISSWNVMGVRPQDFSYIRDNRHYKNSKQEFNTRPW